MAGVIKAKPKGTKGNEEFFLLAGKRVKPVENLIEVVKSAIEEPL